MRITMLLILCAPLVSQARSPGTPPPPALPAWPLNMPPCSGCLACWNLLERLAHHGPDMRVDVIAPRQSGHIRGNSDRGRPNGYFYGSDNTSVGTVLTRQAGTSGFENYYLSHQGTNHAPSGDCSGSFFVKMLSQPRTQGNVRYAKRSTCTLDWHLDVDATPLDEADNHLSVKILTLQPPKALRAPPTGPANPNTPAPAVHNGACPCYEIEAHPRRAIRATLGAQWTLEGSIHLEFSCNAGHTWASSSGKAEVRGSVSGSSHGVVVSWLCACDTCGMIPAENVVGPLLANVPGAVTPNGQGGTTLPPFPLPPGAPTPGGPEAPSGYGREIGSQVTPGGSSGSWTSSGPPLPRPGSPSVPQNR